MNIVWVHQNAPAVLRHNFSGCSFILDSQLIEFPINVSSIILKSYFLTSERWESCNLATFDSFEEKSWTNSKPCLDSQMVRVSAATITYDHTVQLVYYASAQRQRTQQKKRKSRQQTRLGNSHTWFVVYILRFHFFELCWSLYWIKWSANFSVFFF